MHNYNIVLILYLLAGGIATPFHLLAQDLNHELQDPVSAPDNNRAVYSLPSEGLQSAAALLELTVERLQQGQYQAAFQAAGNYLLLYPQHYRIAEGNFYRAVAHYHLGQLEQARVGFNALLTASSQKARRFGVFYWLGLCSYRLGELDTAYDIWLRQLLVREAGAADYLQQTYLGLAQVLAQRGQDDQALQYYRMLEGKAKRKAGFVYGGLALRLGLYHEAYNAFGSYLIQKNIGAGPLRSQALFYQGQAAFFAGLLVPAKQSLDTVLRLYNSRERLFLAALLMRLCIALGEQDNQTAQRFYDQAVLLEQRYRHGMKDWLNAVELPLFMLQGYYPLALKHMKAKLARSQGSTEKEIARFNVALVQAFVDVRYATRQLQKLKQSFVLDIRERAWFHSARLQISFPLTRSVGLAEMESYLAEYPEGVYAKDAVRILLRIYRSDPQRFWLQTSVLLAGLVEGHTGLWSVGERARLHLYWAEMARQLNNTRAALKYLHQSWQLTPQQLVGLQAYYRTGAIYFDQRQYSRALGYFREVQLKLATLPSDSASVQENLQGEAQELSFYTELAMAQSYAGAGDSHKALAQFQQLIQKSRDARHNVQQTQLQLGLVYFYQKAYGQAVDTFDVIISQGTYPSNQPDISPDQYPPALMALYWKGEALFRQGLFTAARQSFRQANEIYPEALGANAYLRAALAAKAAEDYLSVIEDLQQAQRFVAKDNLLQLLDIDFNLVKYNLLLRRDDAAIEAAEHLLENIPPAYDFLGEAFLEIAELHFNQGDLNRSKAVLKLLEQKFIRKLPPRENHKQKRLEAYLQEQSSSSTPHFGNILLDSDLSANLKDGLFDFDTKDFIRFYSMHPISSEKSMGSNNATVLEDNINFYVQSNANQDGEVMRSSIFSGLYLLGIIHAEEQDIFEATQYFLQYLKKEPLGPYAFSAINSVLRLLPELNTRYTRKLYTQLRNARLGDALSSLLFVRYWSLQDETPKKKRALEKIIKQTLSINARKEAMYHLAVYYRKQGNLERSGQLLLNLRNIRGGNLALDPENHWAGLANLELGRSAYREGNINDAKLFFKAITQQAQGIEAQPETLAEALYWLASIAHFEGNPNEVQHYRQSLQELAPGSEWLRKL